MLRAKDGSAVRLNDRLFWSLGVALMVMTTIATTGLRVSAEKTSAAIGNEVESTVTPFDPSQIPFAEHGVFAIRPSMLVGDQMGPYGPLLRQLCTDTFESMEVPDLSLGID